MEGCGRRFARKYRELSLPIKVSFWFFFCTALQKGLSFITTPVFLAGQTGVEMSWIKFHPMYHLFAAMKNAYFQAPVKNGFYYAGCLMSIFLLFLLARYGLDREMKREG